VHPRDGSRAPSKNKPVYTTSLTLLQRLRQPGDQEAWLRFVRLYTPLLYHWARRAGLQGPDAEDLVQDVFELLLRKLPEFRYQPGGSFRSWLRVVALNKWRERHRRAVIPAAAGEGLDQVAAADEAGEFEEAEYRQQLVRRGLQLIQPEFSPAAWRAFQEHVVAGRDAAAVAAELGIRVGTVYAAKSRILTRLRRELHGLLDECL
jgi:RNA polymerase sigma-70 factor (ECF subfamily)